MDKTDLAAASFDKEKYYINSEYSALPESIKQEIKEICIPLAEKLMCTFIIGFGDGGEVYFETVKSDEIPDFDDIGAELEIKRTAKEKKELLKALKLWYLIYKTDEGENVKKRLLEGKDVLAEE